MAVYGYIRVSGQEQVAGTSLGEQRRTIEGAAMIRSEHPVDAIFEDAGVSGSIPLCDRPAGKALWAKLKPGDVVIAAKLDRLFRSAADAEVTAGAWKAQGVKLVLVDLGTEPVTDGLLAKFMFTILAAVAEMERGRIAERVDAGRAAKKALGGHIGGSAPWGYEKQGSGKHAILVALPWQAEAYAEVQELAEAGVSLRSISRLMSDKWRAPISHQAVARIVKES